MGKTDTHKEKSKVKAHLVPGTPMGRPPNLDGLALIGHIVCTKVLCGSDLLWNGM